MRHSRSATSQHIVSSVLLCLRIFFFSLSFSLPFSIYRILFFHSVDICRCCNEVYETHSCPVSPRCLSVTKRIPLVRSCSRWHVHIVASNSRKTNYKWRTGTRLLDSRDGFVTGLPSPFGHSRFDLRPLSVTRYVYWISSDTLA